MSPGMLKAAAGGKVDS